MTVIIQDIGQVTPSFATSSSDVNSVNIFIIAFDKNTGLLEQQAM